MIKLKRAYDEPARDDGERILVERLWPRGLTKQQARIDLWLKEVAPSAELRKWYGHDTDKWVEFRKRYRDELRQKGELIELIGEKAKKGVVTFVYAARDQAHNSAMVLKEFVEQRRRS